MKVADIAASVLGADCPVGVEAYDGSSFGPPDGTRIVIRSPDAIRRIVGAPGELGLARAYVAGDIDVEGPMADVLGLSERVQAWRPRATDVVALGRLGLSVGLRPLPPPPEEARIRGRRHTRRRDAAAVRYHYELADEFYRQFLGPSMTYSCAVFADPADSLEDAQERKYELICRKLGLEPGMRLLDVGCGWGGMVRHAATHHGVRAVGITLARGQAEYATKTLAEAGLNHVAEVRVQDFRDVTDGPFDAISTIGVFEHIGLDTEPSFFSVLRDLLVPGGRLLNHSISRRPDRSPRRGGQTFVQRYVFPDGKLYEVGAIVSAIQREGIEVRHVEALREHYAMTLRHWAANLDANWDAAVEAAGVTRARIWRLFLGAYSHVFDANHIQIHQVLGVRTGRGGAGMPLRPDW